MKKLARFLFLSIISLSCIVLTIGCNPSPTTSKTISAPDQTILTYADPATETTLQGLSEDDLAKYTQYASPEFKAALTQDILDKTANQLKSQIGTYVSKEFLSTAQQDVYTIVHYKAKYTKSSVGIKMVFDQNHLVAGQWFE
jgi:hypothetical protein